MTTAAIRNVRRQYSKALAREPADLIIDIADALFAEGSWPARQVACELVVARQDAVRRLDASIVERWSKGFADGAAVARDEFDTP